MPFPLGGPFGGPFGEPFGDSGRFPLWRPFSLSHPGDWWRPFWWGTSWGTNTQYPGDDTHTQSPGPRADHGLGLLVLAVHQTHQHCHFPRNRCSLTACLPGKDCVPAPVAVLPGIAAATVAPGGHGGGSVTGYALWTAPQQGGGLLTCYACRGGHRDGSFCPSRTCAPSWGPPSSFSPSFPSSPLVGEEAAPAAPCVEPPPHAPPAEA